MRPKNLSGQKWSEPTQIMSETAIVFLDNLVEGNMKVREHMSNLISTLEVVYKILCIMYVIKVPRTTKCRTELTKYQKTFN